MMKIATRLLSVAVVLAIGTAWCQVDSGVIPIADRDSESRMITPALAGGSGELFSLEKPRTNYLRGGVTFASAYDDNVLSVAEKPVNDVSYSVSPSISLDMTRARLGLDLTYSPGFTMYQRTTAHNQADHNVSVDVAYRLSPHVTFSGRDSFLKTSNFFNQFSQSGLESTPTPPDRPNQVVAPLADQISNLSNVGITYQFGLNSMIGASGTFSELHYPNRSEIPGLFDSSAKGAQAFYNHRFSKMHYLGVTYKFQDLLADPSTTQTRTHAALVFYTLYLEPAVFISVFAGPEYSETDGGVTAPFKMWSPGAGASFQWQGVRTNFVMNVARQVSEGGGLASAVRALTAGLSLRRQLTAKLTAGVMANYASSEVLDSSLSNSGGHTISGTASLERLLGQHLALDIGYTHLHQNFAAVAQIANAPDRNRVWGSISYRFERPLGR